MSRLNSPRTVQCIDLSQRLTPEDRERLAESEAAEVKQPEPPESPAAPPSHKSETVSEIDVLGRALAAAPPTDFDGAVDYVRAMVNILRPRDHRAFKLARRVGERAKYVKDHRPHGNSTGEQTWENYCKSVWQRSYKTIDNYIRLLEIDENEEITLTDAYIRVGVKKRAPEPAEFSDYKNELLAMLSPSQRTVLVNGKLPEEYDEEDLRGIVCAMLNIRPSKLPKPTKPTVQRTPASSASSLQIVANNADDDCDSEPDDDREIESRDEDTEIDADPNPAPDPDKSVKERVERIKRLITRFVDAGDALVETTNEIKAEIDSGTYEGQHYSSAKEGAHFKDAVGAIRGAVSQVCRGLNNLYDISEACAHDDLKEIDEARKAFHALPLIAEVQA